MPDSHSTGIRNSRFAHAGAPRPRSIKLEGSRRVVNRRVFVGASMNVDAAINRHRFELNLSGHRNRELLRDWQQVGADNMRFEVLDLIKPRDDPAFDYRVELASMLALWSDELGCGGDSDNQILRSTGRTS
ncbi:MAG: GIY-YIG nuclease family protein [Rubrivivax sp.]